MTKAKHLYLIDGSGYIFRGYYAIRALSTSKGLPTNAIYGFTQMILKLIRDVKPEYWAIVMDTKEPTFRDEMYADYKANRKAPPDDLVPQFEYIPKVIQALNIPMMVKPGFEADDLIATAAKKGVELGFKVTVISGDKDLMQLVGDKIKMWDPMKEKHYDVKEVVERFGVLPAKVADVMGLIGDASDNIPGVAGIGPKTASKLIQEYGDLENLLAHADKIKGKTGEMLQKEADKARLSKKLAMLDENVSIPFDENFLKHRELDKETCHKLFRELEFSKLLAELAPKSSLSREGYRLIIDEAELKKLCEKIAKEKPKLAVDLETTSLDVMKAEIVGFALSWAKGEAAYIPVGHTAVIASPHACHCERSEAISRLGVNSAKQSLGENREIASSLKLLAMTALKPLLADPKIPKIGQNFKYDLAILKRHGFEINNIDFDTMIASYLLNPAGPHNLDDLSQQHLDHRTIRYEEVTGVKKPRSGVEGEAPAPRSGVEGATRAPKKNSKQIPFAEVPLEAARDYACEDADCTRQLADFFLPQLKKEGLFDLFKNLEMPLMEVLLKMEMIGVKVDPSLLKELSHDFEGRLKKLEEKIVEMAKGPFNINSPKQLGEVLFQRLNMTGGKKTKTGFSTSQDVLEDLALKHPLPGLILEYRSLSKLKSTYTDALVALINPQTQRIHTSFNQTVAATGRLSSSDPNLQNIPIRAEEGKKIRSAFVADPGFMILSADYSQIELRILAHYTKDPGLLDAFQKGEDVHRQTAAGIFGIALEAVTSEQRAVGKTVNFAVIYGQTPYGLSKQLKIDVSDAQKYIENYFKQHPLVKLFKEKLLQETKEKGFVTTILGRRRFIPDIMSHNINMRQNAERTAFNTVFQGSAADIIKKAMLAIDAKLPTISPKTKMILQVHDELVFEVPNNDMEKVEQFIKEEMETAHPLDIPILVDCGTGLNWAEAH